MTGAEEISAEGDERMTKRERQKPPEQKNGGKTLSPLKSVSSVQSVVTSLLLFPGRRPNRLRRTGEFLAVHPQRAFVR
jgi:hypothetical protein